MKFDDLYLGYKDEELDVKMALEATGIEPKIAAQAAKYYQMGKAQDLIHTEKALASGANFNTVKNIVAGNITKRVKSRPEFDAKLRNALIKAGKLPDIVHQYHAHHIVAKGAKRARFAVEILKGLGIDIDDPENGVFLPANKESKTKGALKKSYIHGNVHTNIYYANVNLEIVTTFERNQHKDDDELKQDIIDKLRSIADKLRSGTYPLYHYIPGAEAFDTGR